MRSGVYVQTTAFIEMWRRLRGIVGVGKGYGGRFWDGLGEEFCKRFVGVLVS